MDKHFFIGLLAVVFGAMLGIGFFIFPKERWQILAALPVRKNLTGEWSGVNLTWYGILNANANAVAVALAWMMLASLGLSAAAILTMVAPIMLVSLPAAKIIARLVEKKPATLTVAGAMTVGFVIAPLSITFVTRRWDGGGALILPAMAAMSCAYAVGEGLGRLACLSFGCCYGKPISRYDEKYRRRLMPFAITFSGPNKKASYESHLEGIPVVPIQAVTSVVNITIGLVSMELFFSARFTTAILVALTGTQLWRILSEFFRADFRGGARLSVYQIMALFTAAFGIGLTCVFPSSGPTPQLTAGLAALWAPLPLLVLQFLWVAVAWFTGRSRVTASSISIHLVQDQI